MPALFTSTSTFLVLFSADSIDDGSATSTLGEPSRSHTTTSAPDALRRLTIAAPMPCMPPVTIAVRPEKSSWFIPGSCMTTAPSVGPHAGSVKGGYNRRPSQSTSGENSRMAGRLAGKTAFITAAGQGMGRAAALAFAKEGARVWATDLNPKTVAELDGQSGIRASQLDVTDEGAIQKLAKEVGAQFGDVGILFNC